MSDGLRLAITGATGGFGRAVLDWALTNGDIAEIVALGRRQTGVKHPKLRETFLDLCDRIDLESVTGFDALVHLAYCVEEPRNKRLAYQVNVTATRNLLEQATAVGIGHVILTSSANALGVANCGTGKLCTEASYPAGDVDTSHYYFHHKALLEHLANWYWANADTASTKLAVVRPCYVVGENFDNSGLRALLSRFVLYPEPARSFYQFLWESDVVNAYATIITKELCGLYNVAPLDFTSVVEISTMRRARLFSGRVRPLTFGADLLFRLHLAPFSGHWVTLGDPLLDCRLLRATTDWRPSMSSGEALQNYIRVRAADSADARHSPFPLNR